MAAAKDLGVSTRVGRNWRRVDDVRRDCEVKLAQRASTLDVPSSSQEVSEFDGLRTDDLRARAKGLGVTTHVGGKCRTAAELRRACVEKTKALQALSEAESVQAHHEAVDAEVSEFDGLQRDDLRARAQSLGIIAR